MYLRGHLNYFNTSTSGSSSGQRSAVSLALPLLQNEILHSFKLLNPNDFPVNSNSRSDFVDSLTMLRETVALLGARRLDYSPPELLSNLYYFIEDCKAEEDSDV